MKTLAKKIIVLFAAVVFSFNLTMAQSNETARKTTPKPELKTLSDYNAYVKTLDLAQISGDDKRWLENKYNKLIDTIDEKYHSAPKKGICASNSVQPVFSYAEPKLAERNLKTKTINMPK